MRRGQIHGGDKSRHDNDESTYELIALEISLPQMRGTYLVPFWPLIPTPVCSIFMYLYKLFYYKQLIINHFS